MLSAVRSLLEARLDLNDYVVSVERRVDLRDIGLPVGVRQRLLDFADVDAEPRGGVAIDIDHQSRAAGLLVARDVLQQRRRPSTLGEQLRPPGVDFVDVDVLQCVLVLRSRQAAAELNVLHRLQVGDDARHPRRASGASAG